MLRRFLISWLVVSLLGYGMALAADVHLEISTDRTHAVGDHATDPAGADDAADCDHCCHGVLHLLGLNGAEPVDFPVDRNSVLFPYSVSIPSFALATLLRPPILS